MSELVRRRREKSARLVAADRGTRRDGGLVEREEIVVGRGQGGDAARVCVVALLTVLVACGSKPSPPPAAARVGPAIAAAFAAADQTKAPWRCAAADGPEVVEETFEVGGRTWKLAGNTATFDRVAGFPIGVIADAGGAAATTLAALGRLRAKLADVQLVIVLGGMGTTQPEIEATLAAVGAGAPWPVLAIAGDLEAIPAQTAAIAALRARGQRVLDGRLVRRIELSGVTIATLPGASNVKRLVAGAEGCAHSPTDVATTLAALTKSPGIRILATAEAPRIAIEGEAAGELAVTPGAGHEVDIVLHAPLVETPTPARTGERDATAVRLSPGSSDATTRLPGRHTPSAGVLLFLAGRWRWTPIADQN